MRIKHPPRVHIPFAALDIITGTPSLQQRLPIEKNTKEVAKQEIRTNETQVSTIGIPSAKVHIPSEVSSEIKSISSTSFENDTPAPLGVTECPHCDVDFRDMAVSVGFHYFLKKKGPTNKL